MIMPAHKVGRQDWETPNWLFEQWDSIFNFHLDVCATDQNHKNTDTYFTIKDNALERDWHLNHPYYKTRCWMNPPYGRGEVEKWVRKAHEESKKSCLIVGLLPVSTSSNWWQKYVLQSDLIYYLPKRVRFVGATGSPSFDNAIVIWGLNP